MKTLTILILCILCSCGVPKKAPKRVYARNKGLYYLKQVEAINKAGARTDSLENDRQHKALIFKTP